MSGRQRLAPLKDRLTPGEKRRRLDRLARRWEKNVGYVAPEQQTRTRTHKPFWVLNRLRAAARQRAGEFIGKVWAMRLVSMSARRPRCPFVATVVEGGDVFVTADPCGGRLDTIKTAFGRALRCRQCGREWSQVKDGDGRTRLEAA